MTVPVAVQYALEDAGLPSVSDISQWVRAVFDDEQTHQELTVRIVDEAEGRMLNETYRHQSGPTNVLSFPFEAPPGVPCNALGDIAICAPVVQREAREQGKSDRAHWAHMVVHGTLHLLGEDHVDDEQALRMENMERAILAKLGFADPYSN